MPKKPLIFLIPCLLVFFILIMLDEPLPTETKREVVEEVVEVNQEQDNRFTVTLVVGKNGSLKGGFEPIFEDATVESKQIGKLQYNCAVLAADNQTEEDWVYVDLIHKGKGYVRKEAVEIVNASLGSNDPLRQALVQKAYGYLGLRFVRYGKSLTDGIDCSNFVAQIYASQNLKIPDRPMQQREQGLVISKEEMEPGDIIYYDKANNNTGHVGMYLGDGFIINSSGHSGRTYPEGGVRIVRLLYPDRTSYQVIRYIGVLDYQETQEDNWDE